MTILVALSVGFIGSNFAAKLRNTSRLKELIAEKGFRERRVFTLVEIANATGIHSMTAFQGCEPPGCNATADVLDPLCSYFQCRIEQLVEHIPG